MHATDWLSRVTGRGPNSATHRAAWFSVLYFLLAGAYIVSSDSLLTRFDVEPDALLDLEIYKGLGFVLVTSLMLFGLMRRVFANAAREAKRQAGIERALRRSRDQLARAQTIAHLGSWEADLLTDRLEWSDETYQIFGVSRETFGHTLEDFFSCVHPDDRDALREANRRAVAGEGPLEMEHRIVRPDGELRYVFERGEVSFDPRGRAESEYGSVQDITERKRVELELEQRNRQQASIAQLGLAALGGMSAAALMQEAMSQAARILDIEFSAVTELLPNGLRVVAGKGWRDDRVGRAVLPRDDQSHAGYTITANKPVIVEDLPSESRFKPHQEMLDQGVVSGCATVIQGDAGPWGVLGVHSRSKRRFSEADLDFLQALANLIGEVLQRERASRAIKESNDLRGVANQAAALGGWVYYPMSGRMSLSDEVARIQEMPVDDNPGLEEGISRFAPEHQARVRAAFDACVRDGVPYDEEVQLITGRQRRIWVRIIGRAQRDAAGQVVQVHGAIQDISERKALESMLHQAQRLEAVGKLTGGVAHDFNNLLTVIIGNTEQLLETTRDSDVRGLAETTLRAARRGADLTDRLLAYARKQPLEPRATDVTILVEAMEPLLRRSLGEHVAIEIRTAPALWSAMVDPAQLEAALLNLCLNARDAMPSGGHLTIDIENQALDYERAQANDVTPGPYVVIIVTDDGVGMAPDVTERVFEPFFTTKAAGLGSGLGLSMVYGFARQSHGHIRITSAPGEGTSVTLFLPSAAGPVAAAVRTPPGVPQSGTGECILVVEDDDLVRSFVSEQVATLGYRVISAGDAAAALRFIREHDDIALLFTDVVMPGMDGRQLAEAARALLPELPVLFTSGYSEGAIVHQGRLEQGVELLSKPYRLTELADKLRSVLRPLR